MKKTISVFWFINSLLVRMAESWWVTPTLSTEGLWWSPYPLLTAPLCSHDACYLQFLWNWLWKEVRKSLFHASVTGKQLEHISRLSWLCHRGIRGYFLPDSITLPPSMSSHLSHTEEHRKEKPGWRKRRVGRTPARCGLLSLLLLDLTAPIKWWTL